jgi:hypothetical protein
VLIPAESAIFRVLDPGRCEKLFECPCIRVQSGPTPLQPVEYFNLQLRHAGYVVIPDAISSRYEDVIVATAEVDKLFNHFKEIASGAAFACPCGFREDGPCLGSISNEDSDNPCSNKLRFQTPRAAFHQHLERKHENLFDIKLRLDMLAAQLLRELGIGEGDTSMHRIPLTGGRILVSAPGCTAQPPHTDYRVRGSSLDPPSYFVMFAGSEGASLVVWPASHCLAGFFEHRTAGLGSGHPGRRAVAELEILLCQQLQSHRVRIPPYAALVARGDLVHAGDSLAADKPVNVRLHIHCTAPSDTLEDRIYIRPFRHDSDA